MTLTVTHLGTACLFLEIGSVRLLTDPVFDRAGGHYHFGWGTGSTKLTRAAIGPDALGRIDAVLLSHDQHDDNLDRAGRAFLPRAARVLSTPTAAKRLGANTEGLKTWQSTVVEEGGTRVTVTAVPAQHGPFLVHRLSGPTTGFILEWKGQRNGAVYLSGDTLFFGGLREIARRYKISVGFFHVGSASFPQTGPIRFTMNARDALKAADALKPSVLVPIHYEGWTHFREGRDHLEQKLGKTPVAKTLRWLDLGTPTELEV